jgi:hypothetical protein
MSEIGGQEVSLKALQGVEGTLISEMSGGYICGSRRLG